MAILLASIESRLEPERFDCATCIMQYGKTEKMMAKSDRKRQSKGCFDYKSKSYRLENIRYNNCIGNHVTPINYFMEAFDFFEKGVLPYKGNLDEQPNKIIEVIEVIERRRNIYFKKKEKNNQG